VLLASFFYWVAVTVVGGLILALLGASGNWLTKRIRARLQRRKKATVLRVALIDVRSELESARRLLQDAAEKQSFWNPAREQLPGQRWDDHRQTLAEERSIEDTRAAIEAAYQECNRLNQLVHQRIEEDRQEREADPLMQRSAGWALSFDAYEKDVDKVNAALAVIETAISAIGASLECL
jgi:hypothetical protein